MFLKKVQNAPRGSCMKWVCQEEFQENVTFILITGISQREPRFNQAEKTV